MTKAKAKLAGDLVTFFMEEYQRIFSKRLLVNRNKSKWGFVDILEDLSVDYIQTLIKYYLNNTAPRRGHSLQHFFNAYDVVAESYEASIKEQERKKKLLKETEERARKWREKGNRSLGE